MVRLIRWFLALLLGIPIVLTLAYLGAANPEFIFLRVWRVDLETRLGHVIVAAFLLGLVVGVFWMLLSRLLSFLFKSRADS